MSFENRPYEFAAEALDDDGHDIAEEQPPAVLTFALGKQVFAVDVHLVREILDLTEISPLPNAPGDVIGMIDLRGQGIAIVDLASKIGARLDEDHSPRIIVFEFENDGTKTSLGILADRVLRVIEIPEGAVEPLPETLSDWQCRESDGMLRGEDGIAMLLRIESILCNARGPFDFD